MDTFKEEKILVEFIYIYILPSKPEICANVRDFRSQINKAFGLRLIAF